MKVSFIFNLTRCLEDTMLMVKHIAQIHRSECIYTDEFEHASITQVLRMQVFSKAHEFLQKNFDLI